MEKEKQFYTKQNYKIIYTNSGTIRLEEWSGDRINMEYSKHTGEKTSERQSQKNKKNVR